MEIKDAGLIRDQTVGDSTSRPPHYRDPCRDCHVEIRRLRKISDNWRQSTQDGLEVIRNLQTINDEQHAQNMNSTAEINESNRVINSLTCQIKGIAGENDSLRDTINEQHTQINSLTAHVWDAECKVIKISDVVGRTDPYYRSTVMESVAAIVTDIPVGSAIQTDGVAAELDSLRVTVEKQNKNLDTYENIVCGMREGDVEARAIIKKLESENEAGCSVYQRLYQQNHNLVVMAEARNDRIAELESENDDLSCKMDVLPTNFWSVIGERDATIKQQKITIASLERDLIEESKCNDEEWWAQECESLKDTIVSYTHTIDKLKADRGGWKLSLCDACDVIRRFKESP